MVAASGPPERKRLFVMRENEEEKMPVAGVYPQLPPEEQREAEENLLRYLGVVRQIFQHIADEKPELLPELRRRARLKGRRRKGA